MTLVYHRHGIWSDLLVFSKQTVYTFFCSMRELSTPAHCTCASVAKKQFPGATIFLGESENTMIQPVFEEDDDSAEKSPSSPLPHVIPKYEPPVVTRQAVVHESSSGTASDENDSINTSLPAPIPTTRAKRTPAQLADVAAACRARFPIGQNYSVIYVDPPWEYTSTHNYNNAYPNMTMQQLCELPVNDIAHPKGCLLFLWVSGPQMANALRVIEAWNFRYYGIWTVWRKMRSNWSGPRSTPSYLTRPSHEFVLVATSGRVRITHWRRTKTMCAEFEWPRQAHSAKPHAIRDRIEEFLHPQYLERKIELFSRHLVRGWCAWGLDVPDYYQDADDLRIKRGHVKDVRHPDIKNMADVQFSHRKKHRTMPMIDTETETETKVEIKE